MAPLSLRQRCERAVVRLGALLLLAGVAAACGTATRAVAGGGSVQWTGHGHVHGVVDLSDPRADGSMFVAAAGRLLVRRSSGTLHQYAPRYAAPRGLEPYIALSSGQDVPGAKCRFPRGALYGLRLAHSVGVTEVASTQAVRRFATLPRRGLEDGIAFDTTGRFGHRLLVTASGSGRTTVFALDCRGRVRIVTGSAPHVEGGLVVAPRGFGRFGGDLIAPDELSGRIYAIASDGAVRLVANSGIPHGQDVGVESGGFVPTGFSFAYVADRHTPRNRHPGDDLILGPSHSSLTAAGVRAGDLLLASEGGANTIAVTCPQACHVHRVASGPPEAHVEGHIVFGP